MSTISAQLRNFKEPTKDQLTQLYFALPYDVPVSGKSEKDVNEETERMEINAVLSLGVQGEEDSYVSASSEYATPSSMPYLTGPAIMCDALLAMFDIFHVQEKARVLLSALLTNVPTYCGC